MQVNLKIGDKISIIVNLLVNDYFSTDYFKILLQTLQKIFLKMQ